MHKIEIAPWIVEQSVKSRGREHIYDNFVPARTALLVIDMQNAFLKQGVGHSVAETALEIVPNINRIAGTLRDTGGMVVWIQNTATRESAAGWTYRDELDGAARTAKRAEALAPGSEGHALWAELDVRPEDRIVQKTRFSAFIQGSSNIEPLLRAEGIENVIITGTQTNVCCESTARDAMMRNFRTLMVSDANATTTDELHNATLNAMYLRFGDVMPTELLLACLKANSRQPVRKNSA